MLRHRDLPQYHMPKALCPSVGQLAGQYLVSRGPVDVIILQIIIIPICLYQEQHVCCSRRLISVWRDWGSNSAGSPLVADSTLVPHEAKVPAH